MKKIALLSAFALCVFAAGCGNNNPEVENECLDGEECVVDVVTGDVATGDVEEVVEVDVVTGDVATGDVIEVVVDEENDVVVEETTEESDIVIEE